MDKKNSVTNDLNNTTLFSDVILVDRLKGDFVDYLNVATSIGLSELILLTQNKNFNFEKFFSEAKSYFEKNSHPIHIISLKKGLIITSVAQLREKGFDYFFANSERKFFESKVNFLFNLEKFYEKDSVHYRKTALNQVHAALCKKNNSVVVISLNQKLSPKHLGKILQNIHLIKKYSIKFTIFSFATLPFDLLTPDLKRSFIIATNLNNKKKIE